MLQKLPKFLEVAQKTASCLKVAEQLVDRANFVPFFRKCIPDPMPIAKIAKIDTVPYTKIVKIDTLPNGTSPYPKYV